MYISYRTRRCYNEVKCGTLILIRRSRYKPAIIRVTILNSYLDLWILLFNRTWRYPGLVYLNPGLVSRPGYHVLMVAFLTRILLETPDRGSILFRLIPLLWLRLYILIIPVYPGHGFLVALMLAFSWRCWAKCFVGFSIFNQSYNYFYKCLKYVNWLVQAYPTMTL